ncbi:hypothetical protein IJT17_09440, partial [bacterium]|nr:hypothetical protein [bacterium]
TWRIRDDKLGQFIIRLFQDSPSEKVREISCMGLNCYSVVNLKDFFSKRGYYIKTENGPIKIGEGYGFIRRYEEYVVDRDRDGLTELICECVDNMSGSQRVFVYRREGNIIKRGRINPYKLEMTGWTGSLKCDYYELYDPERRVFIVRYTCTDKNTKTITIADYSGFEWEDYACISD